MFGYVRVRKPDLKVKDYECYRGFYCGLCHTLQHAYGMRGQITLTYDMTFLVMLLSSVYDLPVEEKQRRCIVHPLKRHRTITGEAGKYAADMNVMLSYYHFLDDQHDEPSLKAAAGVQAYKRMCRQVIGKYPRQAKVVRKELAKLSHLEAKQSTDASEVAECFGRLLAELFVWKEDAFAVYFRRLGYYLGRYIYLMDAYDDLPEDMQKGRYNPFSGQTQEEAAAQVEQLLLQEIAAAADAFEKLPCIEYVDIMRNILYAGVWNRFDAIRIQKQKEEK